MSSETDPKHSIVILEDMVRQLGLRTGNLHLQIINKEIARTAREIFFSTGPSGKDLEITKTDAFDNEVKRIKSEVVSKLSFNRNLSEGDPLTLPNIQKLTLFRFRLSKQGRTYFEVRASREILEIPLGDGFTTLAARMIINQLKNYDQLPRDPREAFRQFGYPPSRTFRD